MIAPSRFYMLFCASLFRCAARWRRRVLAFGFLHGIVLSSGVGAQSYEFSHLAGPITGAGYADETGFMARFSRPMGVVTDASGNFFVADSGNHTIRKVTPAGVVTTLAGTSGTTGTIDGTGRNARFDFVTSIAIDTSGNLYALEFVSGKVRKITPTGVVTTFSAIFREAYGIAVDASGNIYVANTGFNTIVKMSPAGERTPFAGSSVGSGSADGVGEAARFYSPRGLAVSRTGVVYVADTSNNTIRKISPAGEVTTLAGRVGVWQAVDGKGTAASFVAPDGICIDDTDNLFVSDGSAIRKITPDGTVSTLVGGNGQGWADGQGAAAKFYEPVGLTVDGSGNLVIADSYNHCLRKVTPTKIVSTLAGAAALPGTADGYGTAAQFDNPNAIAVDRSGNTYVADCGSHTIRLITGVGLVSTYAGIVGHFDFFDSSRTLAHFSGPDGVAVGINGDLYVADTANYVVRIVPANGLVSTLAGKPGVSGTADGVGQDARFYAPQDVAADPVGNLYVADGGTAIRKIAPGGVVTTLAGMLGAMGTADGTGTAARFSRLGRLAVDANGNIFAPDDQSIRKISPAGKVTTLKDYLGFVATSVALTPTGDLLVSGTYRNGIYRLGADGAWELVGGVDLSDDGAGNVDGIGTSARFYEPMGMAIDSAGAVYIAERANHDVRKGTVAGATIPTIVTQPSNQLVAPGAPATFTISVAGNPAPTVQWQYSTGSQFGWTDIVDNLLYSGATTTTLRLRAVTAAMDGFQYRCAVTNSGGTVVSQSITLTVSAGAPLHGSRLVNLSARGFCDAGSHVMIGGFVVSGSGTKRLLVRAVGPSLTAQALPEREILADPVIEVHQGAPIIATNDNWGDGGNAAEVASTAGQVGAAALLTSDTKSAALVLNLSAGVYTFVASGKGASSGVVLIEVYDADLYPTATFVNMATRAYSTTNNGVTIGGFVIAGDAPKQVLLRAVGPTLTSQGLSGADLLADPSIELHDANHGNATIAISDDWKELTPTEIMTTGARIGALPFLSSDTTSSAYLATLNPGVYSFIARGKNNASGVVLIEVYDAE